MRSCDLRDAFLTFFKDRQHPVSPSASLIPDQDPTLLFTTAGMVPFKPYFTGAQTPPFSRTVSCQKCVRAGGKHNDLEQVGHTARHHTFFEMLGNFSFGNYFKDEAIESAWVFLTRQLGLDPKRLWVTVYHTDDDARRLWKKIAGLGDERILSIDTLDNFWSAGDTGPCGPCSEIFYDHGPHIAGGLPGTDQQDGDRFVEIWNLVFMQFDQQADGSRLALPRPSIDTGMGLERLAAVMQGVHDNFQTDVFAQLIDRSAALLSGSGFQAAQETGLGKSSFFRAVTQGSQSKPYDFKARCHEPHRSQPAHRVIADHLRASAFLIADGILPGPDGRGYVLRRIMRRALRHGYQLGARPDHMAQLVPTLVETMGAFYPELAASSALITSTLSQEGERFVDLLERGLHTLDKWQAGSSQGATLPGDQAFRLYDTFGFPLDLTQDILRERGFCVDIQGFQAHMQTQRQASRQAWTGSGDAAPEELWQTIASRNGLSRFVGYEVLKASFPVTACVADGKEVGQLIEGQEGAVICQQSPFYAQSGGQEGDQGTISGPDGLFEVTTTHKQAGLIVHRGRVRWGSLVTGQMAALEVDQACRSATMAHHSATHLLQAALRTILGPHVRQQGSLVNAHKLRFDFTHPSPLDSQQLQAVETWVNERIRASSQTQCRTMSHSDALSHGALAFFGEKYGSQVRVVQLDESIELCGGTHVDNTGQIGLFKIVSESSVAAGVRRIEAVAGEAALHNVQELQAVVADLGRILGTSADGLVQRVQALIVKAKSAAPRASSSGPGGQAVGTGKQAGQGLGLQRLVCAGVPLWLAHDDQRDPKALKSWADDLRAQQGQGVIAVFCQQGEKTSVVISVSADLVQRYPAPKVLQAALASAGGGGRADLAQGGGTNVDLPGMVKRLQDFLIQGESVPSQPLGDLSAQGPQSQHPLADEQPSLAEPLVQDQMDPSEGLSAADHPTLALGQGSAPRLTNKQWVLSRLEEAFPGGEVLVHDPRADDQHLGVQITCPSFAGQPVVAQHQRVYAALDNLRQGHLHALSITTSTPKP
jgi:alanyl-tRNA synthetase